MTNADEKQIEKTNANPDLALYYLLHTNPVYQYVTDEENIHIMILGAGDWAQRFIGIALQTCQVVGRSVTITVVCDEPGKTAEEYLKIRPAVPEFVNVRLFNENGMFVNVKFYDDKGRLEVEDGNLVDKTENIENESLGNSEKEMYGTLNFVPGSFIDSEREDAEVINDLFTKFEKPQYVFIDLAKDDNNQNYNVARTFAKAITGINIEEQLQETIQTEGMKLQQITKKWSRTNYSRANRSRMRITNSTSSHQKMEAFDFRNEKYNFINYVITGNNESNGSFKGGRSVFVNQEISKMELEQLDQMAFNAHLSWYNTLNVDQIKERKKFREDTYNYNSSLAFVLSIPYKLWSVKINYSNGNVANAAADFQELLDSHSLGQSRADYLKLIQLEHRRWVLEKICDIEKLTDDGVARGWKGHKIDDEFVAGCIERCSVKDKKEKIHQCIVRSKIEMPLKGNYYSNEQSEDKEPYAGWNTGNAEYDEKLDELDRMSVELHRAFHSRAKIIIDKELLEKALSKLAMLLHGEDNDVLRAFECYRYNIRNILAGNETYSKQFESAQKKFINELQESKKKKVIIGANEQKINELLKEIAELLFPVIESNLYRDYKALDEELVKNIPFILTYKQVRELVLAFDDDRQGNGKNNAIFQNVASATVLNPQIITFLYYYDKYTREELLVSKINAVVSYLKKRIEGCKINFIIIFQKPTQSVKASTETISKKIDGLNIITQEFSNDEEAITFIKNRLLEKINAIYDGTTNLFKSGLSNAKLRMEIFEQIPYFQFEEFQEKHFTECQYCDFLKYVEKGTIIDKTYLRIEDMFALMNAQNTTYDIPEFTDKYDKIWGVYVGEIGETLKSMLPNKDRRWECAVRNWNLLCGHLEERTKDLKLQEKVVIKFDFSNLSKTEKQKKIREGIFVVQNEDFYKEYIDILKNMKDNGFIKDFFVPETTPDNTSEVSFVFTTEKAKQLMCTAGEILEIFTYFEALKTGYFDDIACSYVFRWDAVKAKDEVEKTDELNVENELDCILTKGFKTIIVECKAVKTLEQDFYQKLDSLTSQFGIAEKAVILANTYDQRKKYTNNLMKKRGKLMDIITISDPENIKQIGKNLVDIMEGKKMGKDFLKGNKAGTENV